MCREEYWKAIKLIVPVNRPITQLFGKNPDFYKKWGYARHNGIENSIPNGTPVHAAADGKVAAVSFEDGGYGNYVKTSHMDGAKEYFTYYAHLASAAVSAGQTVKAGDVIGNSNNTGASAGPHLHFGLKSEGQNPDYRGNVDPIPYFSGAGGDAGGSTGPTPSEGIPLPDLKFEVTYDVLNVRNGPGVEYSIVGQLNKGTQFTSKNLSSKSVWVEVESGKWCALQFVGFTYLKIVK